MSIRQELDIASIIQETLQTKSSPGAILEHLKKRPFKVRGVLFNLFSLEILQRKRDKNTAKDEPLIPPKWENIPKENYGSGRLVGLCQDLVPALDSTLSRRSSWVISVMTSSGLTTTPPLEAAADGLAWIWV